MEIARGATGIVARAVLQAPLADRSQAGSPPQPENEERPATAAPTGLAAGMRVALKRLRPELLGDARARAAFARETHIALSVRHPHLVPGLASGEDQHGPYLIMRWIEGPTLRERLSHEGPLSEPLLREIAAQLAGALASLHARGYIHGDVKPENVRLEPDHGAVLLDLGFARSLDTSTARPLYTSATDLIASFEVNPGSLAYLSPEQARGDRSSPQGDMFALGILLFEMATGRHPFAQDAAPQVNVSTASLLRRSVEHLDSSALLAALVTARYTAPSRLVPSLSPFFDHLLAYVLARDPAKRPSASELEREVRAGEQGDFWKHVQESRQGISSNSARPSWEKSPLVGREHELALLVDSAQVAFQGTPRAVWIEGAEGSGKSRLVSELAEILRTRNDKTLFLYGHCPPHDEERPCGPLIHLLERYLGLSTGEEPMRRELAELERLVPPTIARTLFEALAKGLDVELPAAVPSALATWLQRLASIRPVLLFLDDLQNADEGTLGVLSSLCGKNDPMRLCLVFGQTRGAPVARTQALERLQARAGERWQSQALALEPLTEADLLELVSRQFHPSQPARRIAAALWKKSQGNPGLVAEILREWIEAGHARAAPGGEQGLVLGQAPEKLPLPKSLKTLTLRRLGELPALERRWLQRMSVVGGRLEVAFLESAFPGTQAAELEQLLTKFERTGWLIEAGGRYRFARPTLREVVYRSLDAKSRRRYHAQAAGALAPRGNATPKSPSQVGAELEPRWTLDDAFQRAFHLRAAGDRAGLLRLIPPLLRTLLRRGQPHRVLTLARWGLETLERQPAGADKDGAAQKSQLLAFLESAADAADRLGYRAEQRVWLDRLSELDFDPEHDAQILARIYLLHGRYAFGTGQYGLARGMLTNAVQLCEKHALPELLHSESLRRLAAVQTHVGMLVEARALATAALDRSPLDPQRALSLFTLALIDLLEDQYEQALRSVDSGLRLLRATRGWNLPGVWALAHMLRGRIYRVLGRHGRALGAMSHAAKLAREAGERRLEMEALTRLGSLMLEANRPREAEMYLRESLEIAREIEDRRGQALAGLWLGILLWEESEPDSEPLLERVEFQSSELGLSRLEALTRSVRARIFRERGELEPALEASARALELLEQRGAELADRIVITITRALVLHAAGKAQEAKALRTELEKRLRSVNRAIHDPSLRRAHRASCRALVRAVASPAGLIYPRTGATGGTEHKGPETDPKEAREDSREEIARYLNESS